MSIITRIRRNVHEDARKNQNGHSQRHPASYSCLGQCVDWAFALKMNDTREKTAGAAAFCTTAQRRKYCSTMAY